MTFLSATDNKIDGTALSYLTERATEQLVPLIGDRMKLLKSLEELKNEDTKKKESGHGGGEVKESKASNSTEGSADIEVTR